MLKKYVNLALCVLIVFIGVTTMPWNGFSALASVLALATTIGFCNRYKISWLAISSAAFLFVTAFYVFSEAYFSSNSPHNQEIYEFAVFIPFLVLMTLIGAALWQNENDKVRVPVNTQSDNARA